MSRYPLAFLTTVALIASLLVALLPSNIVLAKVEASGTSDIYIVRMVESPAVAYDGGIAGLRATRPAKGKKINPLDNDVVKYVDYLKGRHDALVAKAKGRKVYDYGYSFNGFAAWMTGSAAAALAADPAVLTVEKNVEVVMDTATTPAFLGLTSTDPAAPGLWTQGIKGEGVIVGIIDSGIWPESLSFTDRTDPEGNPTTRDAEDGKLVYRQIPGWHGKCKPGEDFAASSCNQKLIGAQYFLAGRPAGIMDHEFRSPRDYNGHGTHTASTAAGNEGVQATGAAAIFGTVNGIAPRARVAAYKVCWDNGAGGCGAFSSDSVAAIDQAVADGVDVLNYSISGTQTNYIDSVEVAYLFAADAGVFVATSAGNSGPTASTVAHISPWLASVAAGTHNRSGVTTLTLGNGTTYTGASLTNGVSSSPLIKSTDAGVSGADPNLVRQCFSAAPDGAPVLDPAKVTGKIVTCERGGAAPANARVDKSAAVKAAGGVGVVVWNVAAGASVNADLHTLPAIHVDNVKGAAITAYAATAGATASLADATVTMTEPAPAVAGFSSRGPSRAGLGDILKPDFMLPGQDILAAVAPPGNSGKDFDIFSGTSMSSPHVAGVAALLTQVHPEWSPAAMRSAMATTAHQNIVGGYNPFAAGSGQVQPNKMVDPGLVYDAGFNDYLAFLKGQRLCCASSTSIPALDASDLNQPSISVGDMAGVQTMTRTVTNVGPAATYSASVVAPAGFTVSVSPSSFTIPANGSQQFTVAITRTDGPLNTYRFGSLTWNATAGGKAFSVRSPIAIRPVAIAAPAELTLGGADGSTSFGIKMGYNGALAYGKRGLIPSQVFSGTVADDPTDNFDTSKPADNQGIATHDITIAAGTSLWRISMFDPETDGNDDIDLYLYRVTMTGTPPAETLTLVGASGGGTSAEQIQLANPAAGTYRLFVHGWQTDGADAAYKLHSWALGTADAGNMTVTGPATATIGGSGTVELSWTGLTSATRYLGQIRYNEGATTHATTIVRIDVP